MRVMMSGKIHRATVTGANLDYEGSITIDPELMEAANILPYEQVHVVDVTNGARLLTYAIRGERGSGEVCVNGAAAHLVHRGDIVIVIAYQHLAAAEANALAPRRVFVDAENRIVSVEAGDGFSHNPRELAGTPAG
jgi:aspartate 1-decarboxylase